ncbi:MAG: hypothetical protein HY672_02185 [Chloroflexi bacterium]|nr:hypothetical protein [Chloroflexota bacterium]
MESRIVYFEKPGIDNTEEVLSLVKERARALGIKTVIVASTTGNTAVKAMAALQGLRVVVVSHSTGFQAPNTQEFTEENREIVERQGGTILTTTLAFGGYVTFSPMPEVGSVLGTKLGELQTMLNRMTTGGLMANTLRIFGQGMKVVCEISMMAADSGLVRTDEDVISIAGTGTGGRGADTAVVLKPVNSHNFFDLRIREILCKPHF